MAKQQACNLCGGPVRMGGGALCATCLAGTAGAQGQRRVAERAGRLLEMTATVHCAPDASPETMRDLGVLAKAAAEQLAKAWSVRRRR